MLLCRLGSFAEDDTREKVRVLTCPLLHEGTFHRKSEAGNGERLSVIFVTVRNLRVSCQSSNTNNLNHNNSSLIIFLLDRGFPCLPFMVTKIVRREGTKKTGKLPVIFQNIFNFLLFLIFRDYSCDIFWDIPILFTPYCHRSAIVGFIANVFQASPSLFIPL